MDTSETYIKMRLAAIPDLGMGIPPPDRAKEFGFWQSDSIFLDTMGNWYYFTEDESVQLERQDQLQEMVRDKWNHPEGLSCALVDFIANAFRNEHSIGASSMEQLWLAFVEWEKYQKKWSGEEWTVIESEVTNVR